jgi:hypothetical protein
MSSISASRPSASARRQQLDQQSPEANGLVAQIRAHQRSPAVAL